MLIDRDDPLVEIRWEMASRMVQRVTQASDDNELEDTVRVGVSQIKTAVSKEVRL